MHDPKADVDGLYKNLVKRVDKAWIATLKGLESWRFER